MPVSLATGRPIVTLSVIGLITARGGSKSVPRKNLAIVGGKPLIAWTIVAALESGCLDRVIVSTEDEEIAQVANEWGAETPFVRPAELAGDDIGHMPVILHALRWVLEDQDSEPDYLLLLQPTSPLRTTADISAVLDLAHESGANAVVSVCEARDHPYLTKRVSASGELEDFTDTPTRPGEASVRRQLLPTAHALNGSLFATRPEILLRDETLTPPGTRAYVMPLERSLEIDTPWDLHLADLILRDNQGPLAKE